MIFDVIRGIINSSLTLEEKLDRIIGVVEKAEAFEMMAVESAAQFGRKPTWRDRAELLAREERRRPDKLSREDLVSNTEDGINWLKRNIKERKYFEIEGEFKPYIAKHEPPVDDRPIEMLGFAPWEVSLTILTLGDWVNHCSQNDTEAIESIERGKAYLREIQVLLREGGLGDSFWFNEMPVGEKEYPGNVLETAVSISPLNLSTRGLTSDYTESVEEAIAYLMSCRNEHGAWGFKKGWKSDLKCTAITMMALMATRLRRKISFLSDDELDEVIYKGLEGLLRR
jgi:hypothetical protein